METKKQKIARLLITTNLSIDEISLNCDCSVSYVISVDKECAEKVNLKNNEYN